jgi:predicted secreted hydrolase
MRTNASRVPARILALLAAFALALVADAHGTRAATSLTSPALTRDGFTVARAPYAYRFPNDHFAHPGYQTEWWYYTGHLRADDGRTFGFELTFFRVGLHPGDPEPTATQSRWRGSELYPAHFAITDERGHTFFHVERFAREALGMGSASARALDVRVGDWSLEGRPLADPSREAMHLRAQALDAGKPDAMDLEVVPAKRPAIHGHDGISKKAACATCASHYYSYTRLITNGTLVFRGERMRVEGLSWMDHEYGSGELQRDQAGWDWFSVQLDDGRELMLYALREKDGSITPQSSGTLVERDGTTRYLALSDFAIEASARWTSPHTHGDYPSAWRVRVPSAGIDIDVTPTVADQELANTSTGISYWEGAVRVRGRDDATRTTGVGYVELTGYAGAISI